MEKYAVYNVKVPIEFNFTAREGLDGLTITNMAKNYLDLMCKNGKYETHKEEMVILKITEVKNEYRI